MHLLTGIARCGVCGAVARVNARRPRVTYYCAQFHVSRGQQEADAAVEDVVLEHAAVVRAFAVAASSSSRVSRVFRGLSGDPMTQEVFSAAPNEPDRLESVLHGPVLRTFAPLARTAVSQYLPFPHGSTRTNDTLSMTLPHTFASIGDLDAQQWDALSMHTRRELVRALVDVTILPVGRGRRSVRFESVQVRWRS